ncbi:hypothetical protein [Pseudooceanicola sp.]|uniref:hypothetical protein n=1 Tax=Pseudooceanicola sp. TaxID=1914328 RepID=UPI002633F076|nr:hypothetical protein [Pseudooceanicola sp.]
MALPVSAQAPMSAIEWLDRSDSLTALIPPKPSPLNEPPTTARADVPQVDVRPLDQIGDGPVGLIPASVTGLPVDLWQGSDSDSLLRLLSRLDLESMPAMQSLLYSLLLAEARPIEGEGNEPVLLLARIDALIALGAVDPALALVDHAGAESHPELFKRYFDLSVLAGSEGDSCARMVHRPDLAPDFAARIYCLARMGDWNAAMVTYSTMHALGEFDARTATLLELFLQPELIEDIPPLAPPARVTPLIFRLQEAIGQPLATATLPRAYAISDLRNVSGWKAELEAVERLARTGALSESRLLAVYTDRRPAASGGIWDRVAAVQAFDAAMQNGNPAAIADTVTAAWAAMREAGLQVPFARLYGAALSRLVLPSRPAQRTAFRIAMLSPAYEAAAARMPPLDREEAFLATLARGQVQPEMAYSANARAVAGAFVAGASPDPAPGAMIAQKRLGELILQAMELYARAAEGEVKDAARALTTLRAVGLEDSARRAALQLLILDRRG